MREMVTGGEIDALVPERIFVELDRAPGEPRPRRFFEVLHACGALEVLFPELARLYGVPQPARYHPGIDTGVHILLVLEVVASLSADRRVRFAALVHDLGKGTTPREQWPSHRGHEERSVVALIHGLCHRYRVPNDYRDLAVLVARYHGHCHRAPWNCGPARYRRPSKASTPCDGPSASTLLTGVRGRCARPRGARGAALSAGRVSQACPRSGTRRGGPAARGSGSHGRGIGTRDRTATQRPSRRSSVTSNKRREFSMGLSRLGVQPVGRTTSPARGTSPLQWLSRRERSASSRWDSGLHA